MSPGSAWPSLLLYLLPRQRSSRIPRNLLWVISPIVCLLIFITRLCNYDDDLVNGWPDGYAFILSFLAPLWTICEKYSCIIPSRRVIYLLQARSIQACISVKKHPMPLLQSPGQSLWLSSLLASSVGVCT